MIESVYIQNYCFLLVNNNYIKFYNWTKNWKIKKTIIDWNLYLSLNWNLKKNWATYLRFNKVKVLFVSILINYILFSYKICLHHLITLFTHIFYKRFWHKWTFSTKQFFFFKFFNLRKIWFVFLSVIETWKVYINCMNKV